MTLFASKSSNVIMANVMKNQSVTAFTVEISFALRETETTEHSQYQMSLFLLILIA